MEYVSSKQAQKHFNVCGETLRDWANRGKIEFVKTECGHRRYKITRAKENAKNYLYARVSSRKQEGNLKNQIAYLKKRYPSFEVISDIGSGINYKRPGFRKILEQLFERNIKTVVVTSGDRFSRFGKEFFEWLFEQFGAKLRILNSRVYKSDTEELSEDLMEIITVFSARYHGKRRYRRKKNAILSKQGTEASS